MSHNHVRNPSIGEKLCASLTGAMGAATVDQVYRFSCSTRAPHLVLDEEPANQARTFTVNLKKGLQPALLGTITTCDEVKLGVDVIGYKNPDCTLSLTGIISNDDQPFNIIGKSFGDLFEMNALRQLRVNGQISATMAGSFTASGSAVTESWGKQPNIHSLDLALLAVMNKAVTEGDRYIYTLPASI